MRHIHTPIVLDESCDFLHPVTLCHFLGSDIRIPDDRINFVETKRMKGIFPASDSRFGGKAFMPKLFPEQIADFGNLFSVKFLISNAALPDQFVTAFLHHAP